MTLIYVIMPFSQTAGEENMADLRGYSSITLHCCKIKGKKEQKEDNVFLILHFCNISCCIKMNGAFGAICIFNKL